ncbi:hypothetical protein Y032_0370g89 [Ancylostoma ceylanicum]|uniref:Peptidase M28 domain-containing protein n=1 Tax=Ancylostoma ceylanicum TaxID=53326 RepID=A0A016RUJ4_9BILA|nr:hypothetical protein Y032_0370g89 [Ancylostoma ceylanicum]
MKLIRSLAHQPDFLKRDVIFLFNEAEESSLQSKPLKFVRRAHGFICQDAWRRVIRAFISFEASGSGERELLFQALPNQWLLNSYLAAAVHLGCSVVGREVC